MNEPESSDQPSSIPTFAAPNIPLNTDVTVSSAQSGNFSLLQASGWQGPMPSPEAMKRFAEIDPTFPERIMALTEGEARHRREMERTELDALVRDKESERSERKRGQWFGFVLALVFLVAGGGLVLSGHAWAGGTIATSTLATLVVVFVTGRRTRDHAGEDLADLNQSP